MRWRWLFTKFLILRIILLVGFILFILFSIASIYDTGRESILGAHRGNSVASEENTISAFELAVYADRYRFIEFDVQYTKDKVLVVHHDLSLLRIQGKREKVGDLTYEELLEISNYHIPTYIEVMDRIGGMKPLNIEIKTQGNNNDDKEIADYIISDLTERGLLDSTLISSISPEVISYINDQYNNRTDEFLSGGEKDYDDYWKSEKRIETGIIFYVKERTFTDKIPLVRNFADLLRNTGIIDSMIGRMWNTGATYLMIHGANLRIQKTLYNEMPYNTRLVFWTFDDKMFILLPENDLWYKETGGFYDIVSDTGPWWNEDFEYSNFNLSEDEFEKYIDEEIKGESKE